MITGTANTLIVTLSLLGEGAGLADLPFPLIGQAYFLPFLFGLISQAIS